VINIRKHLNYILENYTLLKNQLEKEKEVD